MDKTLIFTRLKDIKKFKTDVQLSDFLGIQPAVLSNWKRRNACDFDILLDKLSPNELIYIILGENIQIDNDNNYDILLALKDRISEQKETIADLRDTNNLLKELLKKGLKGAEDASSVVVGRSANQ